MLYQITNHCSLGCKHCMVDARPNGRFADRSITIQLNIFVKKSRARIAMVSGGEPTEHPDIIWHMKSIRAQALVLASNGYFLRDEYLIKELSKINNLYIQVSAMPDFYANYEETTELFHRHKSKFKRIELINKLSIIDRMGRAKNIDISNYNTRKHTGCANTFLIARQVINYRQMIEGLEMSGYGFCKPMVDYLGNVYAGESRECVQVGTIWDNLDDIYNNILRSEPCMKCKI